MTVDPDVQTVLECVPGFAPRYQQLVVECDGDPGPAVVLEELAELVAELADQLEQAQPQLAACLAAVEVVADGSDAAEELVGFSFLDTLSPAAVQRLRPLFGPATTAVLTRLPRL